jgi:hypothetical protein
VTLLALGAALGWARLAEPEDPSKTGAVGPGLIAVVVVGLLIVATVLLVLSMLKHINRVPPTFDDPPADEEPTAGPPDGD